MTPAEIARVCHEANRAYCRLLGDDSQPTWHEAPTWQRESAIAGVHAALANPEQTPERSHEGWLAVKRAEGWVYGPEKSVVSRTHPCMLPYDRLPESQRRKDELFLAIVRALA